MNINNFQNNVDRKILDRGYDYYIDENIVEFYKKHNNEYVFLIEGSDKYRVDIKIDKDGEILYSNCDCPYDFGAVCKHQIAAFFKLEELLNGKSTDNKLEECQIENKPSMEKILESLSKKKLIDIIENIVENDDVLKNRIVFKYSQVDRDKEIKRCKELMNSIVRKYKGRDGFISYSEAYDFADEMEIILERIKVICETGNDLLLSLEIAFMILNKSMEAFQYTDDSDGNIGMFVSETIKLIGEIAHSSKNMNISREIFNKLLKEAESDVFDGWNDYRIDLIEICSEFADNEEFREQLKIRIESLINGMSDNSYSKYGIERMSLILFNIIDKYGKRKESEKFIQKNIGFSSFRKILIDRFMKAGNYLKVLDLTVEGEKHDKNYAGLVLEWKKLRYKAYKKLSYRKEQERLAKDLLFNGEFEYYEELKKLNNGNYKDFYDNIKTKIKNCKNWQAGAVYLKLIVQEKDIDELMKYVKENPSSIEKYSYLLIEKYEEEVINLYGKNIREEARMASKRVEYKRVCKIIRRYKKVAGKEKTKEIIDELRAIYKRRPAFLDEMGKIK
ncbi:SWIM zinc finger family protein [Clostridium tyrobutyricum]|uniref:SWIM zinc finger family protein n=1 Tax=Clostridium tyrobutyricum TaxID=1519 RepID=UPI00073D917C|nr:hypothetical protein [Clostridium tyrobutyricum]MBV4437245.1 hypothetical protein [Clostridium tyrobutyricum]MEA5009328.1 hypothetical protein [Clostridium tyrobutyricum]